MDLFFCAHSRLLDPYLSFIIILFAKYTYMCKSTGLFCKNSVTNLNTKMALRI